MLVEKGTPGHWARSAPRPGDARGSLHKESWATSEAMSLWLVDEETPGPSRGLAGVSYLDGPWSPWKRLQEAQLLEVGALFHPKQVWVTLRVRVGVKEGEGKGGSTFPLGDAAEQKKATAPPSVHSVPRYKEEGGKLVLTSLVGSPLSCAILVSASADPATPLRQRQ